MLMQLAGTCSYGRSSKVMRKVCHVLGCFGQSTVFGTGDTDPSAVEELVLLPFGFEGDSVSETFAFQRVDFTCNSDLLLKKPFFFFYLEP